MSSEKRTPAKDRVADEIDRNLKKAFEGMAEEPLPDRFTDLLADLRAAEENRKKVSSNDS
ncbi:NepR family anti-sigma factor [Cognatishimia sp. SS12]|uniref:NepR family anti-sigma factor n=1 Tax=Cognatishimia sp. SS12 TaxID=2979465 RepID=UPI00232CDA88|nr:NepR family anti-sigma factor [Cognatishimia sp. SS12]MDC0737860.1 NepR family anti-sigma factor [Cognatishimia sp. SS12]